MFYWVVKALPLEVPEEVVARDDDVAAACVSEVVDGKEDAEVDDGKEDAEVVDSKGDAACKAGDVNKDELFCFFHNIWIGENNDWFIFTLVDIWAISFWIASWPFCFISFHAFWPLWNAVYIQKRNKKM